MRKQRERFNVFGLYNYLTFDRPVNGISRKFFRNFSIAGNARTKAALPNLFSFSILDQPTDSFITKKRIIKIPVLAQHSPLGQINFFIAEPKIETSYNFSNLLIFSSSLFFKKNPILNQYISPYTYYFKKEKK